MNKRMVGNAIIIILTMIVTLSLSSCSSYKKSDLVISTKSKPSSLDWQKSSSVFDKSVYMATMEGLLRSDGRGNITPGIAYKWEKSKDLKTWTFYLRDAKWSDGVSIKAEDFALGIKYLLDPKYQAKTHGYRAFTIEGAEEFSKGELAWEKVGVRALDDKTLQIKLKQNIEYFEFLISGPSFAPIRSERLKQYGDNYNSDISKIVYTGPFTIQSISEKGDIRFIKNKFYWNAEAIGLEKVETKVVSSSEEAVSLFESGKVDVTTHLSEEDKNRILSNKNAVINRYEDGTLYCIFFNCKDKLMKNSDLRKAFSYSLDRTELTKKLGNNLWTAANGVVVSGAILDADGKKAFMDNSRDYFKGKDVDYGRNLFRDVNKKMEEAVFPSCTLLISDDKESRELGEKIVEMWHNNLGIKVNLKPVDTVKKIELLKSREFQIVLGGSMISYPSPMSSFEMFKINQGINMVSYENKIFDDTLKKASSSDDIGKKYEYFHKAEDIVMEDMPIAPLYFRNVEYAINKNIEGYSRSTFSPFLDIINARVKK